MSVLVKDNIILDKLLNKERNQIKLEGDIIVPDVKPDIQKLLETTYKAEITDTKITEGKVIYRGILDVKVLYIASDKQIYSMAHTLNIDDYFDLDHINENCKVSVDCTVTNIDFRIVNDRKINYKAITNVELSGVEKREVNIVKDLVDNQKASVLKEDITTASNYYINEEISVHDEIKIKSTSSNISEILQVNITFSDKEVKLQNGKVHLYGDLLTTVLYKSDDETLLIEQVENETHFSGTLDKTFDEDSIVDYSFKIVDYKGRVQLDDDNEERIIAVDAQILCNLRVVTNTKTNILRDAHIINNKLDILDVEYPVMQVICKNKNQCNIKETLKLPDTHTPVLQVFTTKTRAILDEVEVLDDKTIVSGAIDVDVIYITNDDSYPIQSHSWVIPYEQTIETKQSIESMIADVDVSIEQSSISMLSDTELDLKVVAVFNTEIVNQTTQRIVDDVIYQELTAEEISKIPSVVIHIVEKGDTLWSIAKEYNTTLDDILEVNNLENPNNINVGDRLTILKKVMCY